MGPASRKHGKQDTIRKRLPGSNGVPHPDAVLVIGVHREELAFGDKVAERLDPGLAALLRIPKGLSGRHPRQDQLFYHRILHAELYHQLSAQIRGRYRLALDLHCGVDDGAPRADLISRDPSLLARVHEHAISHYGREEEAKRLRFLLLGDASDHPRIETQTPARTIIPRDVWDDTAFEYVALEVYLATPGAGSASDQDLTLWLIRSVIEVHASQGSTPSSRGTGFRR